MSNSDDEDEQQKQRQLVSAVAQDHEGLSSQAEADPEKVFKLTEKLGEGSYGSVWRAQHIRTGKEYAIKRVGIDNDLQDLQVEITFMKQCRSEYIIQYFGSYVKGSELWIVMELALAGSVSDLMKSTRTCLNEQQISLVIKYVLKGLEYLHARHKLHRDVKAGNVLLNGSGEGKLADFGVSGQLADTMAKRHTVIGTPFWMSPEVIQETGYNEKADIWSVGITCIELAEGKPPYANVHPMRAIFMIPSRPSPTLTDTSKWTPAFNEFIALCLTKNPQTRPSAKELLEHPFITTGPMNSEPLMPLIRAQQKILADIGREKALGLEKNSETTQQQQQQQAKAKQQKKAETGNINSTSREQMTGTSTVDTQTSVIRETMKENNFPSLANGMTQKSDDSENDNGGTFCVKGTSRRENDDDSDSDDGGQQQGPNFEDENNDEETASGTVVVTPSKAGKTAEPSWMAQVRASQEKESKEKDKEKEDQQKSQTNQRQIAQSVTAAPIQTQAGQTNRQAAGLRPLESWTTDKIKRRLKELEEQMNKELQEKAQKYASYTANLRQVIDQKRKQQQQQQQ